MNTRDPQALIEKLKDLPPERMAEVEDFVEGMLFLSVPIVGVSVALACAT